MTLRGYRPSDALPMFLLDRKCFEQRFRFSLHAMRDFAEAENAVTVVAEAEGGIAGFVIAEVSGDAAYLTTVDVDPERRRQGIAGLMLGRVGELLPLVARFELHVHTENASAIGFYERSGFSRVGRVPNFYGPGMNAFGYRRLTFR